MVVSEQRAVQSKMAAMGAESWALMSHKKNEWNVASCHSILFDKGRENEPHILRFYTPFASFGPLHPCSGILKHVDMTGSLVHLKIIHRKKNVDSTTISLCVLTVSVVRI